MNAWTDSIYHLKCFTTFDMTQKYTFDISTYLSYLGYFKNFASKITAIVVWKAKRNSHYTWMNSMTFIFVTQEKKREKSNAGLSSCFSSSWVLLLLSLWLPLLFCAFIYPRAFTTKHNLYEFSKKYIYTFFHLLL